MTRERVEIRNLGDYRTFNIPICDVLPVRRGNLNASRLWSTSFEVRWALFSECQRTLDSVLTRVWIGAHVQSKAGCNRQAVALYDRCLHLSDGQWRVSRNGLSELKDNVIQLAEWNYTVDKAPRQSLFGRE